MYKSLIGTRWPSGRLPQARDAFVDGMVDLEVLTLQIEAALPAVVEPDEGDAGVVGRAFADQEGIARHPQWMTLRTCGRSVPRVTFTIWVRDRLVPYGPATSARQSPGAHEHSRIVE